jgi:hypothetical protein
MSVVPFEPETCSAHGCDEQNYNDGSTQNDPPIRNLKTRYGCLPVKPVHHFPPVSVGRSAPMYAGLALRRRSFAPVRSDVRADYPAFGADRFAIQVEQHGFVWPAIGIDHRAVMAVEPGRAVDQQMPDAMRADMAEGNRRALVLLPSSFGRWVVVRITVTHWAGPIVPSDGIYGFALAMTIGPHAPRAIPRSDETI